MSESSQVFKQPADAGLSLVTAKNLWRAIVPIAVTIILAVAPAPAGLAQHAWYYFAIFAGVIVALMTEPLPGAAVGLIGLVVVTAFAPVVLYGPADLAKPGFNPADAALTWALAGFSNTTVWLIFAAFLFALAYEKTGLGKRIALTLVKLMGRRTLTLGYAVVLAETVLAPVTPSITARSAGTIYPIIRNVPVLYDSKPNDASARRIGSYLMWVAVSSAMITSSLFLTGLAPNLLALEIVRHTTNVEISWLNWFTAFAPVGIPLLIAVPLITYWLYPPGIKRSDEVPKWADRELTNLGAMSAKEITVAALVTIALALWIFGARYVNPTTVALIVVAMMLVTRTFAWNDILKYGSAWNTLGLVRDSRHARRRPQQGRFREMVRRNFRRSARRHLAHHRHGYSHCAVLLLALHVCKRYSAHHGNAARDARGRLGNTGNPNLPVCAAAMPDNRHHGRGFAIWSGPQPRILRKRIFTGTRLLATRAEYSA